MRPGYFMRIVAAVIMAFVVFWFGYLHGKHDEKLAGARLNLVSSLHLYAVAEQGASEKMKSDLAFLVYSSTQEYLKCVGTAGAPADFRDELAEAQHISKQVETNLVVVKP